MRRVVTACAGARIRVRAGVRRMLPRPVRWVLPVLLAVSAGWLLLTRGLSGDGAVLGVLAAGGWSLGLLPVHADPRLTGPRRRSGESVSGRTPVPPLE